MTDPVDDKTLDLLAAVVPTSHDPVHSALTAAGHCLRLAGEVKITIRKTRLPDGAYRVSVEFEDSPAE